MKHQYEDYIKFVDGELLFLDNTLDERGWESITEKNYRRSLLANKATLERHKADALNECAVCIATWEPKGNYKYRDCSECHGEQWVAENFPCPSLLDVTNPLDEVMG